MVSYRFTSSARTNEQLASFCNEELASARRKVDQQTRIGRRLFGFDGEQVRPILKATGLIRKAHPSGNGIDWWVSAEGEVTAQQVANYRLLKGLGLDTKYLHDPKLCAVLQKYKGMRQDLEHGIRALVEKL